MKPSDLVIDKICLFGYHLMMRDWKILVIDESGVDIDVVNGEAAYLDYDTQTGDQRAALAAYQVKGTIPGLLDFGVSWAAQYSQDNTISMLNEEIQQQIALCAGNAASDKQMNSMSQYTSTLLPEGGNVGVLITRGV